MVGGQTMNAKSKPGCVLCEFVMHRVREWLQDGHTVDELEEGLDEICNMMPNSVKVCKTKNIVMFIYPNAILYQLNYNLRKLL